MWICSGLSKKKKEERKKTEMSVVFELIRDCVVKNDKENNDKGAGWGGIRSCHIGRNAMNTERDETKRKQKIKFEGGRYPGDPDLTRKIRFVDHPFAATPLHFLKSLIGGSRTSSSQGIPQYGQSRGVYIWVYLLTITHVPSPCRNERDNRDFVTGQRIGASCSIPRGEGALV